MSVSSIMTQTGYDGRKRNSDSGVDGCTEKSITQHLPDSPPTADCCSEKTDGMKSDFKADFISSVFVCSCLFFSVPFDIVNRASRLIFSKSSCPTVLFFSALHKISAAHKMPVCGTFCPQRAAPFGYNISGSGLFCAGSGSRRESRGSCP